MISPPKLHEALMPKRPKEPRILESGQKALPSHQEFDEWLAYIEAIEAQLVAVERARSEPADSVPRAEYEALRAEVERLRAALSEIRKGEGPFSMDHMEHAKNTIEAMKALARAALEKM